MLGLIYIVLNFYSILFQVFFEQEIIPNGPGIIAQVINLLVLVLIPMVVIHIKDGFSLSMSLYNFTCNNFKFPLVFLYSWCFNSQFCLQRIISKTLVLCSSEFVVQNQFEGNKNERLPPETIIVL